MEEKIKKLLEKLSEIEEKLGEPEVFVDQKLYKELSQEHSRLSELRDSWNYYLKTFKELAENKELLLSEKDPELIQVIKDELENLQKELDITKARLEIILVPPDPRDNRNILVEIRAGTGGDEAAIFAGDLVRMYQYYANNKGWIVETLSTGEAERGGYKEYIMSLSGQNVFRLMQYEGGTHRVQRVPVTESSGRLHTSAATVAVLLEPTEEEAIDIDEKELKIDTYRASGAGGQHVNVTDSAVRITHLPTGVVVACQDERSQHKNKDKAMRLLKAKVTEQKRIEEEKKVSKERLTQVGTGDRSERIRTYNYPQNRISDHRINLTVHNLDQVMEGELDEITNALVSFYYQKKLKS
ncbi:MAG: Peptide chain release factor 1 [Candidatus Anoxychlamydiales bacterium]|nr:Peptide chain release factor 1 [Candidatus Anoxychlamydiales bacterium]NGX35787.1 Peptide chain release factor 1 [Candidatus Anoxychlamydiales bacterium]